MAIPVLATATPPIRPTYIQVNHLLHLILTIITFGVWGLVWMVITLSAANENSSLDKRYRDAVARYQRYQAEMAEYQHKMWMYQIEQMSAAR